MLSLYLHIPFCKQKCAYCSFYSFPAGDDVKARYTAALERAIRAFGVREERSLSTLYIGGGTPALLGGQALAGLIETARDAFGFTPDCEITVELNPESTDPPLLSALRQAGVNRLSVGVQTLDDPSLKTLNRLHSREQALRALKQCFAAGFSNVSADVIFALPNQTEGQLAETLNTLLSFPLTHLSAYALQVEEGTPLWTSHPDLPEEETEERLYFLICDTLRAHGFQHYEISNFAREGFSSRHNRAYWRRSDYLGLGPAAHSFLGGTRYHFAPEIENFLRAPEVLTNPEPLTPEDIRFEQIMLGLRTDEGIPLTLLPPSFDLTRYKDFSFVREGRLILNERGFFLSNSIITDILSEEVRP